MAEPVKEKDGPSLHEYLETRINLLTEAMKAEKSRIDDRFKELSVARLLASKSIDDRFTHLSQMVKLGEDAAQRAVTKAETAQGAHNVAANEWRGTLNDFKNTLITRNEFEKLNQDFTAYRLEVARLLSAQAGERTGAKEVVVTTREDQKLNISQLAVVASVVSAAVAVLLHFLTK